MIPAALNSIRLTTGALMRSMPHLTIRYAKVTSGVLPPSHLPMPLRTSPPQLPVQMPQMRGLKILSMVLGWMPMTCTRQKIRLCGLAALSRWEPGSNMNSTRFTNCTRCGYGTTIPPLNMLSASASGKLRLSIRPTAPTIRHWVLLTNSPRHLVRLVMLTILLLILLV